MKRLIFLILTLGMIFSCNVKKEPTPVTIEGEKMLKYEHFNNKMQFLTLDEQKITLQDLYVKDKKNIIVFAADWCPHCQNLIDEMLYDNDIEFLKNANIIIMFTTYNSNVANIKLYAKNKDLTSKFKVIIDNTQNFHKQFSIRTVPTYFLMEMESNNLIMYKQDQNK